MYTYKTFNHRELHNYHTNANLLKLYGKPESADVYFVFPDEGKQIPAHKCLLAVASPVFQQMFFGDLRESGNVSIVDASHDAFMEFLQFFYCDKFELSLENISEVMTMADKYDVSGLMNLCTAYLERNLSVESVCSVYDLALSFDLKHVINLCEDKIGLESNAVLATDGFKNCSQNILIKILKMDKLSCDETLIYKRTMEWAAQYCQRLGVESTMENKKRHLGQCFELIRFPTMTAEDFTQCISDEGLFDTAEFLEILSYLTIKKPMKNCRFPKESRCGIPAWIKDNNIRVCDRRSLPNLKTSTNITRDITKLTVNERILLGQLSLSPFESEHRTEALGQLTVTRCSDSNKEPMLSQSVSINTTGFSKVNLKKPLILQPFEDYEIETNWILDANEKLRFRAYCRSEIMVDGGIRFQFSRLPNLEYDNVGEGLIAKLYFKTW